MNYANVSQTPKKRSQLTLPFNGHPKDEQKKKQKKIYDTIKFTFTFIFFHLSSPNASSSNPFDPRARDLHFWNLFFVHRLLVTADFFVCVFLQKNS